MSVMKLDVQEKNCGSAAVYSYIHEIRVPRGQLEKRV